MIWIMIQVFMGTAMVILLYLQNLYIINVLFIHRFDLMIDNVWVKITEYSTSNCGIRTLFFCKM